MRFPIEPMTLAELRALTKPQPVEGGNMEAVPMPLYDTQLYTSATTVVATFFGATQNSDFLSSLAQGGQLPDPDFFRIYSISMDILGLEPASNQTNARDVHRILYGQGLLGAPFAVIRFAGKTYGPWPLSAFHGTGGPTGYKATTVTNVGTEVANNGFPDGGLWIGGAITLPPLQAFQLRVEWSAPVTLAGNVQLRMTMWGTRYREIH